MINMIKHDLRKLPSNRREPPAALNAGSLTGRISGTGSDTESTEAAASDTLPR